MKYNVALRPKMYSYHTDDKKVDKKAKGTQTRKSNGTNNLWIKKNTYISIKHCLGSEKRFRSKKHNIFTEKVSKIALSGNDDKRIKTPKEVVHLAMMTVSS